MNKDDEQIEEELKKFQALPGKKRQADEYYQETYEKLESKEQLMPAFFEHWSLKNLKEQVESFNKMSPLEVITEHVKSKYLPKNFGRKIKDLAQSEERSNTTHYQLVKIEKIMYAIQTFKLSNDLKIRFS